MMNIIEKFLVIVAIIGIAESSTPIRSCNNGKPLPLMVQIDNCDELPCDFWKGSQTNMAVQFVANKNSMSQLHADVSLKTLGALIPFKLEEERSNICKNLMYGAYCPLDAGEDATYNLSMQVSDHQPELPVTVQVNLIDRSDNSVVACFITNGRIKKNSGLNQKL